MISKINIDYKTKQKRKEKETITWKRTEVLKEIIEMSHVQRFMSFTQRSVPATLSLLRDQRNGTQMPKAMQKFPVGREKD